MIPRTWPHNGHYLTAREIAALNPRLNLSTVEARLAKGATAAEAIAPKMSRSAAGRKGRLAARRVWA